nr:hypothetical protein CFP56_60695 [Quercus suber]
MPEPLPPRWSGSYDDPPASESSTPRTRRSRLQRALQSTTELAREAVNMADVERRTHEAPPSRRRQRSPGGYENDIGNGPSRLPFDDEGHDRRRSKRRRLDWTPGDYFRPAIQYGHYGQVEPASLQMELLSCDGGEHVDDRYPQAYLGAKNVLRHDKSVYCSERSHTNLVLTHADQTAFCLEKLHIVGPEHGFTAP